MIDMPKRPKLTVIALLLGASLLGACGKGDDQPPANQASTDRSVDAPPPAVPVPAPTPVRAPEAEPQPHPDANVAAPAKPAEQPTADQQILDDADATGMTSHAPRPADPSDLPGNGQR